MAELRIVTAAASDRPDQLGCDGLGLTGQRSGWGDVEGIDISATAAHADVHVHPVSGRGFDDAVVVNVVDQEGRRIVQSVNMIAGIVLRQGVLLVQHFIRNEGPLLSTAHPGPGVVVIAIIDHAHHAVIGADEQLDDRRGAWSAGVAAFATVGERHRPAVQRISEIPAPAFG